MEIDNCCEGGALPFEGSYEGLRKVPDGFKVEFAEPSLTRVVQAVLS
jgi:hypothetical protein